MNRLNEFFNLQMKTLMTTQRTSTIETAKLFCHTALITSYCANLKDAIEAAFGEHVNNRHQIKDTSQKVCYLAYQIVRSRSITKHLHEHSSSFQSQNILQHGIRTLSDSVKRFNKMIIEE